MIIIDMLLKQTSEIQAKKMKKKFWGNFEQHFWMGAAMVMICKLVTHTMCHEISSKV